MAQKQVNRTYQMSDADLIQKADDIAGCMTRDAAAFTTRGVTTTRAAALVTARDQFSDFPTDEELQGTVTVQVEVRDAQRTDIEKGLRRIRNMAEIQYHTGGLYRTFGFEGFIDESDSDLVRTARRVIRVATRLLSDLTSQGLTAGQISTLGIQVGEFDTAIDAVADAVEDRDIQTQQRIIYGNALFASLSEFASIGKAIYEDTDEAKYNDYVVNDTPPPPPPPPQTFPGS